MNRYVPKEDTAKKHTHMKRYSTSLVTREIPMKTMTRYHDGSLQMAKIKAVTTPNTDEGAEHLTLSHTDCGNAQWHSYSETQFGSFYIYHITQAPHS